MSSAPFLKGSIMSIPDSTATSRTDSYLIASSNSHSETSTTIFLSTLKASIVMITTIIGVGVLTLPAAFAHIGWVTGLLFLLFATFLHSLMFYCFSSCQLEMPDCESYSEMNSRILGKVKK